MLLHAYAVALSGRYQHRWVWPLKTLRTMPLCDSKSQTLRKCLGKYAIKDTEGEDKT